MEKGRSKKRSRQDQSSPGVLKGSQPPPLVGYETQSESIEDLPTDSIQPCPYIPDYRKPTESFYPIVVQTPEGRFCIDGGDQIEQAKTRRHSTIRCFVVQIARHSDIEVAIRKAANRTKPRGGRCFYPESVRDTRRLFELIRDSSEDLVVFCHGGDRRGPEFKDHRENSIKFILARRLGLSTTTINKRLQHGEHIDAKALEILIDAGAPKRFFETFQQPKQDQIIGLTAAGNEKEAIPGQRSEKSKLGSSADLATAEIEQLYPTISVPVTVALFDLGRPCLEDYVNGPEGGEDGVSVPADDQEEAKAATEIDLAA